MKTIWKYPLEITDKQMIELPIGAEILSVIAQGDVPTLYAVVDPGQQAKVEIKVRVVGTGHPLGSPELPFVGTVSTHGGSLVWHVFAGCRRYDRTL